MERKDRALFGASVTASAMLSAGFGWTAVLPGWLAGAGMLSLRARREDSQCRGGAWWTLLGAAPVMAAVLLGADGAFPEETTFPFISVALLALLWRAMIGRGIPDTAELIGLALLPVLAVPVLFGMGDVNWTENLPETPAWRQVLLSFAATAPWWTLGPGQAGKRTWGWYSAAAGLSVGMSLLTHGILGGILAAREVYPLYRTVQTIRVLGVLQRLESFVAAGLLMGAFALLLMLARQAKQSMEFLFPQKKLRWRCAALLGSAFALEWAAREAPASVRFEMETVFWGFLAIYTLGIVYFTKFAKRG